MFKIRVQHNDHAVTVEQDGETDYKDVIRGLKAAIKQISGAGIHDELKKELDQEHV